MTRERNSVARNRSTVRNCLRRFLLSGFSKGVLFGATNSYFVLAFSSVRVMFLSRSSVIAEIRMRTGWSGVRRSRVDWGSGDSKMYVTETGRNKHDGHKSGPLSQSVASS